MAQVQFKFEEFWQTCITCGVYFAFDRELDQRRRQDKQSFYCPNGHSQAYTESEADRLRKQLSVKEAELSRAQQRTAMERSMRESAEAATKRVQGQLTRQTKRVNAGVCPHCNRTFQQLARHMDCKHRGAS